MERSCHHFRIRHMILLLILAWAIVSKAAADAQEEIAQKDEETRRNKNKRKATKRIGTRPSVSTKYRAQRRARVTAPLRSDGDQDLYGSSYKMDDYSIAHHARYLAQKNANQQSYFENLLRLEEEERQRQTSASMKSHHPPPRISPTFVGVVGSAVLFAISAFAFDPSSATSLWKSVINKKVGTALAVAWLPWCWYHPAKLAILDLLVLIQLVRQPALVPYLQKEVIPILWKTFRTMILTEIWTRTWKWVFTHVEQIRQYVVSKYYDNEDGQQPLLKDEEEESSSWKDGHLIWPAGEPPSWLVQLHVVVVGSVRKGIKSAFKKSIQETIHSAFSVWKTALQEQIMVAAEWK